jgi:hypothetical protein
MKIVTDMQILYVVSLTRRRKTSFRNKRQSPEEAINEDRKYSVNNVAFWDATLCGPLPVCTTSHHPVVLFIVTAMKTPKSNMSCGK